MHNSSAVPGAAPFDQRFGADMRAAFAEPRLAALRELTFGRLSAMELRCDVPNYGRSAPVPVQDALLVSLQLRANSAYDIWEDGKRLDCLPVERGMLNINDLRKGLVSASNQPFHALIFTLPMGALDEDDGAALDPIPSRTAVYDPVIEGLGMALLPALESPESAPQAFIEHVLLALRAHLAHRLGGQEQPKAGRLSSRQLRLARDFLEAHLAENLSLSELAASCSLSPSHFARSFRRATGLPPHRYLVERRVALARELLLNTTLPLVDIAARCGFADQSHLTKAFRRVLGVTPGSLRPAGR